MNEQLKKFKLKWVKYEGWSWVGEEPVDAFVHECELVRAEDADALAARLAECEKALEFYASERNWMTSRKDALHEAKMTIAQDLEFFGYSGQPGLASTLLLIGGKRAREYFEKWGGK